MITAQVYIEHQLDTHTSFGVRVDTGERVFISSKLVKKYGIEEEELRELTLLPNAIDGKTDTPWKAIGISIKDAAENTAETPRVELAKLEDRILEYFENEDCDYPHTAPALAEALGVEDLLMQATVTRMHGTGELAKAQVFAKGTQEKASTVLWAPDITWFSM